jgi:uncharacterized protein
VPHEIAITLPPSDTPPAPGDEAAWRNAAAKRLRVPPESFSAVRVIRVSFDARPRRRGWRIALRAWDRDETPPPTPTTSPPTFSRPAPGARRAVVIGSGPAGLFCALDLLAAGIAVTVLERGRDVRARRKPIAGLHRGRPVDPDCNYCFGEGGAGTYSDGKLHTRSGRKRDVRGVLEALVAHGAAPEILVSWRPHVGSNRLPGVVRSLRETIVRSGGEVYFDHRAEEIETRSAAGGKRAVAGVRARDLETGDTVHFESDAVVLATGHSALDALLMARRAGAGLEAKGFAMGVRIEHRQEWLDRQQYGDLRNTCDLPPAAYELARQVEGRGVYSFCMCPGGFIVPSSTAPDRVVVNGMSLSRRDSPFANAGIVVSIEPEDWCGEEGIRWGWPELLRQSSSHGALPAWSGELPGRVEDDPLFGVRLQIALEMVAARAGGGGNRVPAQRTDAFVEAVRRNPGGGRDEEGPADPLPTSYRPGVVTRDLHPLLPPGLGERLREGLASFDGRLPGFVSERGQLLGVESRTSSPVRLRREEGTRQSPEVERLYPCGEGAGFAGGIISSALDGRRTAAAIAEVLA